MHADLCMHILPSMFQDGSNPFPVTRLPVLNSMTDSSRHTLQLPTLHSQWSCQVYTVQVRTKRTEIAHITHLQKSAGASKKKTCASGTQIDQTQQRSLVCMSLFIVSMILLSINCCFEQPAIQRSYEFFVRLFLTVSAANTYGQVETSTVEST